MIRILGENVHVEGAYLADAEVRLESLESRDTEVDRSLGVAVRADI